MGGIPCGPAGKCKNCGHDLWQNADYTIEHHTRIYKPFGHPYSTHDCRAPGCQCQKPEPFILDLVLTGHWFDEIKDGPKRIEYRDNTDYWRRRIKPDTKYVRLRRAYTKTAMVWRVAFIEFDSPKIKIHLSYEIPGGLKF